MWRPAEGLNAFPKLELLTLPVEWLPIEDRLLLGGVVPGVDDPAALFANPPKDPLDLLLGTIMLIWDQVLDESASGEHS